MILNSNLEIVEIKKAYFLGGWWVGLTMQKK